MHFIDDMKARLFFEGEKKTAVIESRIIPIKQKGRKERMPKHHRKNAKDRC